MTREQHMDLFISMVKKSEEEVNAICDSGIFNDIIKGYAAIAMKQGGLTEKQVRGVDFYSTFDEVNAYKARQIGKAL